MATNAELISIVCIDTGLDESTGSRDRSIVLARMNEAYERIIFEANSYKKKSAVSLTAGQEDFTIGPDPSFDLQVSDFISFDFAKMVDSNGNESVLEPVTKDYIVSLREGSNDPAGISYLYSYNYPYISFYPAPGSATGQDSTMEFWYTASPPRLIDAGSPGAGEESTPSAIPPIFHRLLLARLTTIIILEGFDGRADEASYHRSLYIDDLEKFKMWTIRSQGINGPYQGVNATTNRFKNGSWDTGI